MRRVVADFVAALHHSYADAAEMLPLGERGRLPLLNGEPLTVLAVGAGNLHILGTSERLAAPTGPEVQVEDSIPGGPTWVLRFLDPVVVPALGLVDESQSPAPEQIRRILGVDTHHYHLVVQPGGSLSGHHAQHAGTGLAHAHAAAARDYEAIRAHSPGREVLVDEAAAASSAGLPISVALLAARIAPCDELEAIAQQALSGQSVDLVALRRTLLERVRPLAREVNPR